MWQANMLLLFSLQNYCKILKGFCMGKKKDKNYSPSLNIEKINQHLAYNADLMNKLAVLHQQCCFAIIFCLELQYMYIMLIYLLL